MLLLIRWEVVARSLRILISWASAELQVVADATRVARPLAAAKAHRAALRPASCGPQTRHEVLEGCLHSLRAHAHHSCFGGLCERRPEIAVHSRKI